MTIVLYGLSVMGFVPLLGLAVWMGVWGGWGGVFKMLALFIAAVGVCIGLPLLLDRWVRRAGVGGALSVVLMLGCWTIVGGQDFGPVKIFHDLSRDLATIRRTPEQNYRAAEAIMQAHPGLSGFDGDDEAFAMMKASADSDYAPAQYELGLMWQWGVAMHLDIDGHISRKLFEAAARQGYAKAKGRIALNDCWYLDHKPEATPQVLTCLRQADPSVMAMISDEVDLSIDMSGWPDWQKAERISIMKLSAESGDRKAMAKLAEAYAKGECGVKIDIASSEHYAAMARAVN